MCSVSAATVLVPDDQSTARLQQVPGLVRVPGEPQCLESCQRLSEERWIVSGNAEGPEREWLAERSGVQPLRCLRLDALAVAERGEPVQVG